MSESGRARAGGASIRGQAIRLLIFLCFVITACGGLILAGSLSASSAASTHSELDEGQLLTRTTAADVAADSDALRALELHPNRTDRLSQFTVGQIRLANDLRQLSAQQLPPEVAPQRDALVTAVGEWSRWAGRQGSDLQDGLSINDDDGAAVRTAVVDAARDFNYAAEMADRRVLGFENQTRTVTLIATACGVVLGLSGLFVLAWSFFKWNLWPLERLAQAAGDLAAGRDAEIGEVGGSSEVMGLAAALQAWRRSMEGRVAIADATTRISGLVEMGDLLKAGSERLSEALDAAVVSFNLELRDGTRESHIYSATTRTLNISPRPMPGAPSSVATEAGRPVIGDLTDDGQPEGVRKWARENRCGPVLSMPMVSGGRVIGAVSFVRRSDRPSFNEGDVELGRFAAAHVAAAIHVVELLGELTAANASLAQANQHKSEFLAIMSHELRTPLNSILGFSQLLEDESFGPLTERQARYVGHIRSSGGHLLALINDVLDLSKVEAGQLNLDFETVPLESLVAECVGDVRPLADDKHLDLRYRVPAGLRVRADRRRLAQVALNLLSNAIKFTPEGGRVTVAAVRDGDMVSITVRDTGIGIEGSAQKRIFDAFFQVGSGRTRQQEGTGLGLALSRRLVEMMGGTLNVASRPGRGSTFRVRIPAAAARAEVRALRTEPVAEPLGAGI